MHTRSKPGETKAKTVRAQDMLAAGSEYPSLHTHDNNDSEHLSASTDSDRLTSKPTSDADVIYNFDLPRGPSAGEGILNTALARAIEQYEDKETVRLVRKEYDLVDERDGDAPGFSPARKVMGKGHAIALEDQEYEFV